MLLGGVGLGHAMFQHMQMQGEAGDPRWITRY